MPTKTENGVLGWKKKFSGVDEVYGKGFIFMKVYPVKIWLAFSFSGC